MTTLDNHGAGQKQRTVTLRPKTRRSHLLRLLPIMACAGALAACSNTSNPTSALTAGLTNVSSLTGGSGPRFESITPKPVTRTMAFAYAPSRSSIEYATPQKMPLKSPAMQRYMQSIVKRMLNHWKGDLPDRIGLFLTADNQFAGFATSQNDILISYKAIQQVKSEDELAALLAHELGHVLLKHHSDEAAARNIIHAGIVASRSLTYAKALGRMQRRKVGGRIEWITTDAAKKKNGKDMMRNTKILLGGISAIGDVGVSVMNRRQEFAADTFALEMLNASGYDPAATLGILEYIQAAEVADKKVKKRYRLSAKSIEGLFSEIAFIGLAELSAAITKSHPSADRRLKSARAHLRKMLGDKDTPAVRTAALNRARSDRQFRNLASFFNEFYKQLNSNSPRSHARVIQLLKTPYGRTASARTQAVTALLQVRPETSLKLLQTATMQSTAPAGYFAIRASIEAGMKKSSDAKRTISRMAARYGWRATYQTALNTAFRLGDAEWTASLLQRCRARGDKKLAQACVTASRGVSSDEQHKVPKILTTLAKTVAPGGAYHGGLSANNGVRVKGVAPGRVSAPVIANNNPLAGLLNAVGANTAAASTNRGRIVRTPTTGTTPANPLGALLNTIGSAVSQ